MMETILARFMIPGTFVKAEKFGPGLINDTYLSVFAEGDSIRKYILQRINTSVFRQPAQVMENVETVTLHMVNRLRAEGVKDPFAVTPALVKARDGGASVVDPSGGYWRVFHFIESAIVFDRIVDADHAYETGRGLGRFQALVADLPPARLHDTLPGFHHTPKYLREFDEVVKRDLLGRVSGVGAELRVVGRMRPLAPLLTDLLDSGALPLRVVHNDPKVNNILIHSVTREAVCMIDLDTVKPGIVHFDFGDCARSAANPLGEDAEDPDKVSFDLSLFEALTKGYLREASGFLTDRELATLPVSVQVITFELGLRFLTDYLRGDTYFKIRYPSHNLHRARVQFKLLDSIESVKDRMKAFILRC